MQCSNYRGIKILEKILDKRLRQITTIDRMQFGFSEGKGTTNAIFMIRPVQEKMLEKNKKVFTAFLELEKAYDRVPREPVYRSLRKKGLPEYLVELVEATNKGVRTKVRTAHGYTEAFGWSSPRISAKPIFVHHDYGYDDCRSQNCDPMGVNLCSRHSTDGEDRRRTTEECDLMARSIVQR